MNYLNGGFVWNAEDKLLEDQLNDMNMLKWIMVHLIACLKIAYSSLQQVHIV